MPSPKDVASYPTQFFAIVRKTLHEGVTIPLDSVKVGTKMRLDFYAWRKALKREDHEFYRTAALVTVKLQESPPALIFQNREEEWAATLNKAGVDLTGYEAPTEEEETDSVSSTLKDLGYKS